MTDVSAEHDVIFILKNRGSEARPNHQPVKQRESDEVTSNAQTWPVGITFCFSPVLTGSKVQKFLKRVNLVISRFHMVPYKNPSSQGPQQ